MFPTIRITPRDREYPPLLTQIPQPPAQLFCRGDITLLRAHPLIAVVGSRKMSPYGMGAVREAVRGLVTRGYAVVSGLAFGIDHAAHFETVACGGRTIAVLGSPVEPRQLHPRANGGLAERILKTGGLLVSEYPSGTPVYASHFPERNRIIAGLCESTLVVEASEKSGALITARFAVECGRDVYAVPGSIFSPVSVGTNRLIERGATPWLSCASLHTDIQYERSTDSSALALSASTDAEQQIIDACADAPQSLEQLCESTGLPPADVMQCVTMLVLNGLLRDLGDTTYVQ